MRVQDISFVNYLGGRRCLSLKLGEVVSVSVGTAAVEGEVINYQIESGFLQYIVLLSGSKKQLIEGYSIRDIRRK